jgi:hypothetical protein
MEKIACETREEYDVLKKKALMAKVVLLDRKGEHPLMNPSLFSGKKKKQFLGELSELMNCDIDTLTEQFNDVVNHNLLTGGADISQYPIYETPNTAIDKPL